MLREPCNFHDRCKRYIQGPHSSCSIQFFVCNTFCHSFRSAFFPAFCSAFRTTLHESFQSGRAEHVVLYHHGIDMLRHSLTDSVKDALKIVQLTRVLYLYDNLTVSVLCLYIHTVELVTLVLLIALALKNLHDMDSWLRNTVRKPSRTPKLAFWRNSRFMAQSKRMCRSLSSAIISVF